MMKILKNNSEHKLLLTKSSFSPNKAKIQLVSHIVSKFMGAVFGIIYTNTQLENLLSVTVIVTHSKDLLISLDIPVRVYRTCIYQYY